ncbi:MAG: zinc ribbon domain-containing protein [Thaumarchaeota archaeon]|nr:zinc ribbon domain-containing protein [Nitrososphaerota archaeon]
MKVFNGKAAAQDYMSNHTLTFSTPELTLTRFAFWLGDMISDPKNPGQTVPRIMAFVEEKDFAPVPIIDDETFVPTGAIRSSGGVYGGLKTESGSETKFCSECGVKLSLNAKFCTECGTTQDQS